MKPRSEGASRWNGDGLDRDPREGALFWSSGSSPSLATEFYRFCRRKFPKKPRDRRNDVLLDSCGATVGILICRGIHFAFSRNAAGEGNGPERI